LEEAEEMEAAAAVAEEKVSAWYCLF